MRSPLISAAAVLALLAGGATPAAADFPSALARYVPNLLFKSALPVGNTLTLVGHRYNKAGAPVSIYAGDLTSLDDIEAQAQVIEPIGKPVPTGSVNAASRNRSCAVGYEDAGLFTPFHAYRWTQPGGLVDLGTLDAPANANLSSFATGVAADCSVIVGLSDANGGAVQRAFRWTAEGGMVNLGLPAGARASGAVRAFGASANGDVIVGDAEFPDPNSFSGFRNSAFRWVGGAFHNLGALADGYFTVATAASASGAVIVGQGGVSLTIGNTQINGSRAFRWTAEGGLAAIGPLAGDTHAAATAVSDDGRVIVGTSASGPLARGNVGYNRGTGVFRWTEATGTRDLRQLLIDAGFDMTGITLVSATGISPDGEWIAGEAVPPTSEPGAADGFIVRYCDNPGGACGTAPSTLNAQGLWWADPPGSESGWGINFAHQGDILFATWFTYDAAGKPTWFVAELHKSGEGVYSGSVFSVTGVPYDAPVWDTSRIVEATVGTMMVTFSDAMHGSLAYTVNGVSQTKAIVPQAFASPVPACVWGPQPNLALATNYQDLWWAKPAGSEAGWGVNFTQQGDIIFLTWFTYDASGLPTWFIAVASKTGEGVFGGPIYTVVGNPFDAVPWDPGKQAETEIGATTITFADGNNASFTYTINGVTQTKPITRQVFVPPGTVCN